MVPPKFNARAGLPKDVRTSDRDTVLHIKGIVVDTLHTIGKKPFMKQSTLQTQSPTEARLMWYQFLEVYKDLIKEAIEIWLAAAKVSLQGRGSTPEVEELIAMLDSGTGNQEEVPWNFERPPVPSKWEPFLQTLTFNQTLDGIPPSCNSSMIPVASFVLMALQGPLVPTWFRQGAYGEAQRGALPFLRFGRSRRFAATDKELIGFVPTRAKEGDLICILYGVGVPFVLRKTGSGRYLLVGECYMHGIMHGEGLRLVDTEYKDVEFALE